MYAMAIKIDAITIITIVIVVIITCACVSAEKKRNEQREILKKALDAIKSFNPTKVIKSEHPLIYYFGVDDKRQEIFCFSKSKSVRFRYQDVITAEVIIDGKIIQTKKSASIGGAVVGGVVAGGLGAIIGGSNMGTATSTQGVTSIKVHILLRNAKTDSFDIICHESGPIETTSDLYESANANARAIFDVLRIAMDKATTESKIRDSGNATTKSSIDELKELADLKKQGLITEEEFTAMKAKIISK